ncbi:MBL fold metallo-hydrolase [Parvularcula lutaonensis]|uniref:Metallo-beta-lactamase domain-containing protein n=1 Tax=Parvularcula lutaonensis TaxID=491923 RepID=A0ABV7MD99_9PROT|nr:hypothetical protein [Parvularcula lutaonensis]GGY49808.1 hypothetical protein GCM10007148_18070 [Parvularcula lutaonensis]
MRRSLFLAVPAAVLAFLYWWAIENSVPEGPAYDFQIERLREAAEAPAGDRPIAISVIEVGRGRAPGFAVGLGLDFAPVDMTFSAFRVAYPDDASVLIEAPADRQVVEEELGGDFYPEQYARLVQAMDVADAILVTHEHLDHISVVPRHPRPEVIAPALRLTPPQIAALPQFAPNGVVPEPLDRLIAERFDKPRKVAPGIAVLETPGHTEGSLTIYVQLADGQEFLMIGDIAWNMRNIEKATTRPRIMQTLFFDPPEDRRTVQAQVRALHELSKAEPDLLILPAHDAAQQELLMRRGVLQPAG